MTSSPDASPIFTDTPPCPPFDPEVYAVYEQFAADIPPVNDETLPQARQAVAAMVNTDLDADGAVVVTEREIPGPDGAPDCPITILSPATGAKDLPCIYYVHGGGLVLGDRRLYVDQFLPWVAQGQAVVVSIGYRFAPEHAAPAHVEDCYAGLEWTAEHAAELGVDPDRILAMGVSAGGGLALGIALMARDFGGPKLTHLVLEAPMLDDRFELPSSRMLDGGMQTDRNDCLYYWTATLGERRGAKDVSPYVAPARATNLSGLPPTYLECGGSEGFRDEVLTMAMRLSQAGVLVDVHMLGGGFHGFSHLHPEAAISQVARRAREEFIARALRSQPGTEAP